MKNIVGKKVKIVALTDTEGVSDSVERAIKEGCVFTITEVTPDLRFPIIVSGQDVNIFAVEPDELRYMNNRRVVL